jgi:ELWxxDGT repeat protein
MRRVWVAPASGADLELVVEFAGGFVERGASDLGARAVFRVRGAAEFAGVWATDGTPGGTERVFAEASAGSNLAERRVFAVDGAAVFFADDGVHGDEPWRTDGTPAGTALVADIRPGSSGSEFVQGPGPFERTERTAVVVAGRLVFLAYDGLWVTDGTAETTYPFASESPNLAQFHPPPVELVEAGGRVAWRSAQFLLGSGSPIVAEVGAPGSPPPAGETFVHVSLPGYSSPRRLLDEVSSFRPPTPSGAVAGVLAVRGDDRRGRIAAGNWRVDLATLRATRVPPGAVGTLRDPVDEAALGEGTGAAVVFRDRRGRDVVTATSGVPRRAVGRRIVFAAGTRVSLVGDAAAGFVAVVTPRSGEASLVGLPLAQ